METIEHTDEKGRKYSALSNGQGSIIIQGPPEGLVDSLDLPEPFATRLHNVLYARSILNYSAAARAQNGIVGALQEALQVDAQRLLEAMFKFEQGGRND